MRKTVYLLLSLTALAHSALADCIEFRHFRIVHGEEATPGEYLKKNYKAIANALEAGFLGTDTTVVTPILEGDKIDFTNTVPFQHPVAYGEKLIPTKLGKIHLGTAVAAFLTRKDSELSLKGMYYNAARQYDQVNASQGEHISFVPVIQKLKTSLELTLNMDNPQWIITPIPHTPKQPATYLALKYHKGDAPSNKGPQLEQKQEKQPAPKAKETKEAKPESEKE